MKNIVSIFFILFLLIKSLNAYELKIVGLNKLSLEDIENITKENIYDDLNSDQLNNIIQNLYKSDLIYDLNTYYDQNYFVIEISESKIIENIFINGNVFFNNDDILALLETKPDKLLNTNNLLRDIKNLKSSYKASGHNDISISSQVEKYSADRINLILNITEGPKFNINKIKFHGNKFFSDRYLRDYIKSDDVGFINIFSKGSNFSPELYDFDVNLIKDLYSKKGFFNVEISYQLIPSYLGSYFLNFYIREGDRSKILSIDHNFISLEIKDSFIDLIKHIESKFEKNDGFYDQNLIDEHIEELNKILKQSNDNTYFSFNFNPTSQEKIIFFNQKKLELVTINKIDIYGNTITKDKTIRSKLLFQSGDILSNDKIVKTNDYLKKLKYINDSTTSYSIENSKADILIDLEENTKTGNFLIAGSVSGDTGLGFAFGLKDSNLFGSGNEINSSFNINTEKTTFNIDYVKYSNTNYLTHTYSVFNEEKDLKNSFGFKSENYGLGYSLSFKLSDKTNLSSGIKYERIEATEATKDINAINDNIGKFNNIKFSLNYSYDSTNDIFYPTEGNYQSVNFQISPKGMSDDSYYKINLNSDFYKNFNNNFVFLINNLGYADSFSGNLKTVNSFGLGGLNFKGFDYRGIGPSTNDIYLGGNKYFTSTIGYGGSFLFDKKDNVNIKLFLTSGSLWESDYATNNNLKLRTSLGLSLDFLTPVGPLTLFYAAPLKKYDGDKVRNFNFTLGTSF